MGVTKDKNRKCPRSAAANSYKNGINPMKYMNVFDFLSVDQKNWVQIPVCTEIGNSRSYYVDVLLQQRILSCRLFRQLTLALPNYDCSSYLRNFCSTMFTFIWSTLSSKPFILSPFPLICIRNYNNVTKESPSDEL